MKTPQSIYDRIKVTNNLKMLNNFFYLVNADIVARQEADSLNEHILKLKNDLNEQEFGPVLKEHEELIVSLEKKIQNILSQKPERFLGVFTDKKGAIIVQEQEEAWKFGPIVYMSSPKPITFEDLMTRPKFPPDFDKTVYELKQVEILLNPGKIATLVHIYEEKGSTDV